MTEKEKDDAIKGLVYLSGSVLLLAFAAWVLVYVVNPGPIRRWRLEQQAEVWRQKKTITRDDADNLRWFGERYRREFGREWDAPAR